MIEHLEDELSRVLSLALSEDHAGADITTSCCVNPNLSIQAKILLKQKAVLAGLAFLPKIFHKVDPELDIQLFFEEGEEAADRSVLATIDGKASSILAAERSALNLLQHLSGVATLTASCVKEVEGFSCDILDTRKTLPGLRALQKYAVRTGGGKNHRFHLADRILIKNNHIKLLKLDHSNPVFTAVTMAKTAYPESKVEIEVEDLDALEEALTANADLILLDNMSLSLVQEAVKRTRGRAYLEASGNMTKEKLRPYAEAGINGISIGALTHSSSAIDMSLKV